ncbi:MAG TPA: thermonuclease family protein [Thermoplasmata archaeon]|jgi:endonuclease YncB( thermonuclease family)|nr:thermonuclease family protein [Thermoplasmata archaeon]
MERKVLAAILAAIVVVAVAVVTVVAFRGPTCWGVASCLAADVEKIVDGDTLDIGGVRVRLALVNSPDIGEPGYSEATQFTAQTCPIGSRALVDEDDGQTGGSYGRMVALVYCGSVNLNAELLRTGHAVLLADFCAVSEFARDGWAGCP